MKIGDLLSGEWMLHGRSNGGSVVLFRSCFIAMEIYFLAIAAKETLSPDSTKCFDLNQARRVVMETIPWFGAIVAVVYAALYARFSSQWQYLADLYNRIMEVGITEKIEDPEKLKEWRAAFIEDAYTLHLACKPMFASAINGMLKSDGVAKAYIDSTIDGRAHLSDLRRRFERKGLRAFDVPEENKGG